MDNSEKKPAVDAEKEHSAEYWKAKCLAQKDEVAQTRKELQDLKDFVKLSQQTFQEQISMLQAGLMAQLQGVPPQATDANNTQEEKSSSQ
eukprot:m.13665 g.13665  ORF g.13665 m.13665 type:complete len:90 (-) comp4894_c0_seq1:10-279(-)